VGKRYLNLVGPQIRRIRYGKGWFQNDLAIRLQIAGLDKDRTAVGKIESQLVHVSDFELLYLREVLDVELVDLYPILNPRKKAKDVIPGLMQRRTSAAQKITDMKPDEFGWPPRAAVTHQQP
jgi:transcriptional regulator with XRE-family HTH domain